MIPRLPEIIIGQRYHRLIALRKVESRKWLFICDCGRETIAMGRHVKRGGTRSCGCLSNETRRRNRMHRDIVAYKMLYRRLINTRGGLFRYVDFSFEEFMLLIKAPCHYCGDPPVERKVTSNSVSYYIEANGLDRIDSSTGYKKDNVVSCCWPCNKMKNNLDITVFIAQVKKIAGLHVN